MLIAMREEVNINIDKRVKKLKYLGRYEWRRKYGSWHESIIRAATGLLFYKIEGSKQIKVKINNTVFVPALNTKANSEFCQEN